MDALKKAEQSKLGQAGTAPPAAQELALAPENAPEPAVPPPESHPPESPTSLPELPKLEDLDDEFLAHARQSAAAPRGPTAGDGVASRLSPPPHSVAAGRASEVADRQTVRNAFAVKQVSPDNRLALIFGVVGLLAVAGIGIYFWLQLRPAPNLIVPTPNGRAANVGTAIQAPIPPARPAAPAPEPTQTIQTEPSVQTKARIAEPAVANEARRALPTRQPAATASPTAPIRISSGQAKVNPTAIEGYEAFQAGNLAGARAAYERLLTTEPWNRDALHGLAAIAQREARTSDAEVLYMRLLEADPRDAQAQAGLFGIRAQRGQGDPVAAESRLKSLLAGQPESAPLHFALGNLYARQNRWSEAQQAYFQALAGDAGNPDTLFNLAVSLDQLHQAKLAAQYYGQALAAAEHRPAAFDRSQVAARLNELRP